MKDLTKAIKFIPFDNIISFGDFEAIGYFPYENARVKGLKVPRNVFDKFEHNVVKDNKVVVVFKDKVNFGTNNFAIFFHDYGAVMGGWDDVIDYQCKQLKYKTD